MPIRNGLGRWWILLALGSVIRHNPAMTPPNIHKVAVLFPEFLGDYINLIPFLHRLGALFPAAEVTLYISPSMVDFAGRHPAIHRCLPIPERGTRAARKTFAQDLRSEKYDMAYFTNPELLWIVLAARIRHRIHHHSDFLLKFTCKGTPMLALRNRFKQTPERHVNNLDALSGQALSLYDYNYDTGIQTSRSDLLSDIADYVVVNPDSHSCKRFDQAFFVHVIRWLISEGHTVVQVGLKDPHGLNDVFGQHPQYRYLVGKTSIPQLMDIMAYASLFLGIDSGTAHLASVLGTPTLVLYPPKGATPAVSCLVTTKALPYQYTSFDSTCALACWHYQSCPFDTCTQEYNLADVETRIRETMKADFSQDARWRMIYQTSTPILVIPKMRSAALQTHVTDFAKSGISIRLGASEMADWSFAQMLVFIHRYNIRVIFWEGRPHVPLKWRILNRWLRFSDRWFCGMTAGVVDQVPEVFFDRCFTALVWPLPSGRGG